MFKDPIKPKVPKKKIKSPWDFSAPNYDQRSGPSVAAGDYYGVGFKNPVGRLRGPKSDVGTYPLKDKQAEAEDVVKSSSIHPLS